MRSARAEVRTPIPTEAPPVGHSRLVASCPTVQSRWSSTYLKWLPGLSLTDLWFARFGDIPGLVYTPLVPVERNDLRHAGEVPEVHRDRYDGAEHVSLWWGNTSASPAAEHDERYGGSRRQP